jgi:AraC-like DNA-binding protein
VGDLEITKSLEIGKFLLKAYTEKPPEEFQRLLADHTRLILRQTDGLPQDLNARLTIVLSGILTLLFENDAETIIRKQTLLAQGFLSEQGSEAKVARFVETVTGFLRSLDGPDEHSRFAQQVLLYVRSCNLTELRQLSVERLADKFGYNRSAFSRKFRQESEESLQEVLVEERLKRAHTLLLSRPGRITLKTLAQLVGFSDPAHFAKRFREKFGPDPAAPRP